MQSSCRGTGLPSLRGQGLAAEASIPGFPTTGTSSRRDRAAFPETHSPPPAAPAILQRPRSRQASHCQGQSFLCFQLWCCQRALGALRATWVGKHETRTLKNVFKVNRYSELHNRMLHLAFSLGEPQNAQMCAHTRNLDPHLNWLISQIPPVLELQTLEWWVTVIQSCPTLSDPMDCSLPGSSVHGILQARLKRLLPKIGHTYKDPKAYPQDSSNLITGILLVMQTLRTCAKPNESESALW